MCRIVVMMGKKQVLAERREGATTCVYVIPQSPLRRVAVMFGIDLRRSVMFEQAWARS